MKHFISFTFFLCLSFSTSVSVSASEYIKEIIHANDLYEQKLYKEASQAYESLIHSGVNNGYLHYNLGNTYIRMGKSGLAILNYIHALKWIPRDENLQANLKFAIQQTQDKIEPPAPGTLGSIFFWVNDLNLGELVYLSMGINLVFWVTLALWMVFRSPTLQLARNALLCILLLSFLSIGVKLKNESSLKLGVVLVKRVEVKSGHVEDAVTLFQLNEGALVTVTDKHEDWIEVRLNNRRKGWVSRGSIGT